MDRNGNNGRDQVMSVYMKTVNFLFRFTIMADNCFSLQQLLRAFQRNLVFVMTVTPIVSFSMFENILSDVAAPVGFRIKYRILPFIAELLNLESNINGY